MTPSKVEILKRSQPKYVKEELEHFRKTGIPRCCYCQELFVNGVDSITKKVSKYLWVPTCECVKNIQMCIG